MTWTRLFHIRNIEKAFARVIPGKPREELAVSKRYQAEIRKQFRLNGVPWLFNLVEQNPNPRDKQPKMKKREKARGLRLAKIQKALQENETKELQFQQMRLNKRPLKGLDKMLSKGLPSWIKGDTSDVPQHMQSKKDDDNDDE